MALALLAISFAAGGAAAKPAQAEQSQDRIAQQRIEAMEAIQAVEQGRIASDKAYAETMLRNFDLAEPLVKDDPLRLLAFNTIKMVALVGAGRLDEADALSRRTVAANPDQSDAYKIRFSVALARQNAADAIAVLETADRKVKSPAQRKKLATIPSAHTVNGLQQWFQGRQDTVSQQRLAEVLLRLNWDGDGDPSWVDSLRMRVLKKRLEHGDTAAAKALADAVDTPQAVLTLLVMRKYDVLVEPGIDRNQRFQAAVDLEAARTLRDLSDDPDDDDVVLRRIAHLSSLGKNEEILTLTAALAADMELVAEKGQPAFWAISDRAKALRRLGRSDESIALMEKLIAPDFKQYPELINMRINHLGDLSRAGRHAAAFEQARALSENAGRYANAYGHRWIWSSAACALAAQGKVAEAETWLAKLRDKSSENYWALNHALICTDKLDEAELLMVKKLGEDSPIGLVGAFQNYKEDSAHPSAFDKHIEDGWRTLADRPAVKAAFDKVGRVLTLPTVASY